MSLDKSAKGFVLYFLRFEFKVTNTLHWFELPFTSRRKGACFGVFVCIVL